MRETALRLLGSCAAALALAAAGCAEFGDGAPDPAGAGADAGDGGGEPDARGDDAIEARIRWSWSGDGYWNLDKRVGIDPAAPSSMWITEWSWIDAPGAPAAMLGIATDADRLDGTAGDTAFFASFSASDSSGASCGKVEDPLGQALGCRVAMTITSGAIYRLRVWRLEGEADGQWWGGWILDEATGMETFIGSLRVAAASTGITAPSDRVAYLGAGGCDDGLGSVAFFAAGAANQLEPGVYEHAAAFDRGETGICVDVAPAEMGGSDGARVSLGP